MRTIKFQLVFDTAIGTYITKQSYTIEDFLNFRYGLDCLLEKETENFGIHDHDAFFSYEPKFIAKRQFTGLLDKNGVEVFDGDVVKSNSHKPTTFKIEFIEGGFCATQSEHNYPLDINHFYPSTGCMIEVIGNIFQHHHLLEANHDR